MDWIEIISSLGFPIACVVAMAAFIYKFYVNYTAETKANMEKVQARCKEREEKLYEEIKENREINGRFADIIARYDTKLDEIKTDVKEIKEDIIIIKSQQ